MLHNTVEVPHLQQQLLLPAAAQLPAYAPFLALFEEEVLIYMNLAQGS